MLIGSDRYLSVVVLFYHSITSYMIRWPKVGLLLGQRRRRWANSKPTLGQRLVLLGSVWFCDYIIGELHVVPFCYIFLTGNWEFWAAVVPDTFRCWAGHCQTVPGSDWPGVKAGHSAWSTYRRGDRRDETTPLLSTTQSCWRHPWRHGPYLRHWR